MTIVDVPPSLRDGALAEPAGSRVSARPRFGFLTVIATIAPGLVVFVLPTVDLISSNREFFQGDFTAGRDLYLLAVLVIATGFGLWVSSGWPAGRFLWTCYLLVTPGWLAYSVLRTWDRAAAGTLVVVSILAVAWMVQRGRRTRPFRTIGLLGTLLLLSSLVTTTLHVGTSSADSGTAPDGPPTVVGTTVLPTIDLPNIYHVVLDEYQTQMFEVTLDSDLRNELSGFIFYPDARTTFGRTEMSMATILGQSDYDYETTPQEFVDASLRGPESSLYRLRRLGYRTTGYAHLPSLYGSPTPFDEGILFRDYVDFDQGADYVGLANSLWLYANSPDDVTQRLLPNDHYAQLAGENLLPNDAPPLSVLAFKTILDREEGLAAAGRYTLIHLILPHFPYVMSADCRYAEGVQTAPAQQAECATSLIVALVDELRELDRFDSSFIVIHGDHGARFRGDGEQLDQLPEDLQSVEWNDARSRVLLLIKPAGSDGAEPLAVEEFPALLTDVMPTMFDSIEAPYEAEAGRVSLLGEELPDRPTRYYHFYDKGDDGLPDGELMRYVIESGEISRDRAIEVPSD